MSDKRLCNFCKREGDLVDGYDGSGAKALFCRDVDACCFHYRLNETGDWRAEYNDLWADLEKLQEENARLREGKPYADALKEISRLQKLLDDNEAECRRLIRLANYFQKKLKEAESLT